MMNAKMLQMEAAYRRAKGLPPRSPAAYDAAGDMSGEQFERLMDF